jgi:hypothetical protein
MSLRKDELGGEQFCSACWHGIGCNRPASPRLGVIFFQQYRTKQANEIEPPAVEPPPLPSEEEMKAIDTVQPIHIDDEQYALLTLALRPGITPVREARQPDAPGPKVTAFVDKASQPPAEQPPGTPIV